MSRPMPRGPAAARALRAFVPAGALAIAAIRRIGAHVHLAPIGDRLVAILDPVGTGRNDAFAAHDDVEEVAFVTLFDDDFARTEWRALQAQKDGLDVGRRDAVRIALSLDRRNGDA